MSCGDPVQVKSRSHSSVSAFWIAFRLSYLYRATVQQLLSSAFSHFSSLRWCCCSARAGEFPRTSSVLLLAWSHQTHTEVKPMKAIVLHEYGGPEKLKYEDAPDPEPGEGQVLVRVAAASINPIDWKMRSGIAKERFPVEFPGILGRDVSGTVRSVGPKVEGFAPGDKVMALAWKTYAELCVVNATDLAHIPEGLDLVEAAALPLVTTTGEQLIRLASEVQKGQTVLVTGAVGSVGRSAVFVAKQARATVI